MSEEESVSSVSEESAEESVDEELIEVFDESSEWKTLKDHPDYEICVNFPHQIRKKSNGKILMESVKNNGYVQISFNKKNFLKHRLIALQFIPNPNNLPQVDHINHIRTDNRISNIRWCSHIQNNNNKGKSWTGRYIEYVDELPDDAFVVESYKQWSFENLHFATSTNKFYFFNGINYKVIRERLTSNQKTYRVSVRARDGKVHDIAYSTFKNEYGLN